MKRKILSGILGALTLCASAAQPSDFKVFVNPGHGGHDANDRWVEVYPFTDQDPNGFWESNSNLDKGKYLKQLLEGLGFEVGISRTTNTTADDLGLTTIAAMANTMNADLFLSIHSNATGTTNRINNPVMMIRQNRPDYDYTDPNNTYYLPSRDEDWVIGKTIFKHLITNETTYWTSTSECVVGDYQWMKISLGVLRQLAVPGMLSEGSFHDYVPETYRLLNNEYKYLEAWNFACAICDHLGCEGFSTGLISGSIYDERLTRNVDYKMFGRDLQEPICNATVVLKNASGVEIDRYVTDALYNGVYLFKDVAPGDYSIEISQDEHFTETRSLSVTANKVTYSNIAMKKVRNTPPSVVSASPVSETAEDLFNCVTPIKIQFNWDMDEASTKAAFSISPAIEGDFTFEDANYRLVFTPKVHFDVNTEYTVTIDNTAMHQGGTAMTAPYSFKFNTQARNELKLLKSWPTENCEVHYATPTLEFRFDNLVNSSTLITSIDVTDEDNNSITKNARKLKKNTIGTSYGNLYIPLSENLVPGKNYTITLVENIVDAENLPYTGAYKYNFKAIDCAEDKGCIVVDDCEALNLTYNAEGSTDIKTASAAKNTSTKLFGSASACLKFTFADNSEAGKAVFDVNTLSDTKFTNENSIGLHVSGDLNGHHVIATFKNGTETKDVDMGAIDFNGWRYMTKDLSAFEGGKEYQLSSIAITEASPIIVSTGTIYIDNIIKSAASSVSDIEATTDLTVYPNPASSFISISTNEEINSVDIIATNGVTVMSSTSNTLNVSELAQGTYLVKITTANGVITKSLIITH